MIGRVNTGGGGSAPDLNGATLSITSDVGATVIAKKGSSRFKAVVGAELPSEYTRVEYIESHGTEYINTGYMMKPNSWVHAKLFTNETGNKNWFGGTSNNALNTSYIFNAYSSTQVEFLYGTASSYIISRVSDVVSKVFTVDFGKNKKLYINDTEVYSFSNTRAQDTNPLYILSRPNGTASARISGKIYEFKIFEDETKVIDLVPCYRKADGVIGLYDIVNGQFYTNNGTGTFGKGAEIGTVTFTVRNSGIWTVTASKDGAETITKTVNVTEDGATYSVSMLWKMWIIKDGTVITSCETNSTQISSSYTARNPTITSSGNAITVSQPSGSYSGQYLTTENVDLSKFTKLCINIVDSSSDVKSGYGRFGVFNPSSQATMVAETDMRTTGLIEIDISSIGISAKVGLFVYCWGGTPSITFDNLWLE